MLLNALRLTFEMDRNLRSRSAEEAGFEAAQKDREHSIYLSSRTEKIRCSLLLTSNSNPPSHYARLRAHHSVHGHLYLSCLEHGVLLLPSIPYHLQRCGTNDFVFNRDTDLFLGTYDFSVAMTSLTYIPSTPSLLPWKTLSKS